MVGESFGKPERCNDYWLAMINIILLFESTREI